jgi:hypothetical protein
MPGEPIGEIPVVITGDYSALQAAIEATIAMADEGASKIADAFNIPSAGSELVTAAEGATTAIGEMGDAAETAGSQMGGAAGDAGDLGQAAAGAGSGAGDAAGGVKELGDAAEEAGGKMEGLGENLKQIAETMGIGLGIAEGIETLKELATESVDAAGRIQMASDALEVFTGDAEKAKDILEQMKSLAMGSIFSFPDLTEAAQKMSAVGISTGQVKDAMTAATMAAQIMHGSVDTVAASFDRLFQTGVLGARQLVSMGITASDLGSHMTKLGLDSDSSMKAISAAFKDMGSNSSQAVQILTDTITDKLGPAFAKQAQDIPVQINTVKVAWDSMIEDFGKAAAPDLTVLLSGIRSIIPVIGEVASAVVELNAEQLSGLIESFKSLEEIVSSAAGPVEDLGKAILATLGPASEIFGQLDINLKDFSADLVNSMGHWRDLSDAINLAVIAWDDLAIGINKVIQAYDTWRGDTEGAAEATARMASAMVSLQQAEQRVLDSHHIVITTTDQLTMSVSGMSKALIDAIPNVDHIGTSHGTAGAAASGHAKAQREVNDAYATVPTYAQTIQAAMDAIDAKILVQNSTLQTAIGVYKAFASSGTATAQELADAWKKVVTDSQAAGVALQPIKDKLDADLASAKGLQAVIVDGHTVWVQAGQDVVTLTEDQVKQVAVQQGVADTAAGAADKIVQLRGALDQAKQSYEGLSRVFTDGTFKNAADLIAKVNGELDAQVAKVKADTDAWNALVDATSKAQPVMDGVLGSMSKAVDLSALISTGFARPVGDNSLPASGITGNGVPFMLGGGGLMPFADGGHVEGGVPIVVGEQGPEVFLPDSGGQIIPNSKIGSALTSTTRAAGVGMSQEMGDGYSTVSFNGSPPFAVTNAQADRVKQAAASGGNAVDALLYAGYSVGRGGSGASFDTPKAMVPGYNGLLAPSYQGPMGLPSSVIGNQSGSALPGGGGGGLTLNVSFAGATIYGQQGADQLANTLTSALKQNAGQLKF